MALEAPNPPSRSAPAPISLALQGGGSHGAFAWGVLDALLEDGRLEIRAVSGASAGAMNGVVLAAGMIAGGADGARERLERFWRAISQSGARTVFGDLAGWEAMLGPGWLRATPGWRLAQSIANGLSPYEFNPLNLNPLRDVLAAHVDFAALRERSPVRLYVSATAVRTGRARIFRTGELTCDHLIASACLPHVFQAVEIDREPYWDGGYLANPALWPMFYDPTPDDILLVTLNPLRREATPKSPDQIADRLQEITFNASLLAELRAVAFVGKLIDEGALTAKARNDYRSMRVHAVLADEWLADLDASSKSDTDWSFLLRLKERGRGAAAKWLRTGLADVGVRSSPDLLQALI